MSHTHLCPILFSHVFLLYQDVELCNEVTMDATGDFADEASAAEMLLEDAAEAGLSLEMAEDPAPSPHGVGVKVVV